MEGGEFPSLGLDDNLDNLMDMLGGYEQAPQGLDDLIGLPAPQAQLKAELSDSDESKLGPGAMAEDGQGHEDAQGNRRRRIRNAKQQELNRLAQQRYRQRKKKKFDDLQVAVEELSNRMAIITRLEGEATELRRREAVATAMAATKELALQHAQAQLAQQQRTIAQQEQQLLALAQPPAPSPSQQEQLTDSQQQQLCSKLLAALKDALNEVCSQHGLQASTAAQDQVLLRFQRSLSSCCREVLIPLPASAAAAMQAPAGANNGHKCAMEGAVQAAVAQATAAVAGTVPAAAPGSGRVSVTCY